MDTTENKKCVKCDGETAGYKCNVCGVETVEHDADHACGENTCAVKCVACNEAETKCAC